LRVCAAATHLVEAVIVNDFDAELVQALSEVAVSHVVRRIRIWALTLHASMHFLFVTDIGISANLTRDRCFDFLNMFAENFSKKIRVFNSKQS
jgi:hypothetical protein